MGNITHQLTDEQAKFCLLYVNAPAPYMGDALSCYELVYGKGKTPIEHAENGRRAKQLLQDEEVRKRIEELEVVNLHNAASLRPRITETLLNIMGEMSVCKYYDKEGTPLSPAAARSVAVNAAKTLNDMYGIKEDILHKVQLEGKDGSGITFNVIMPEKRKDLESELDIDDDEDR